MNQPIRRHVVLPCRTPVAFRLFTERIDDWWPPERRHVRPHSTIVLTPERFAEYDHNEEIWLPLGKVTTWNPPDRLVLDWYPGTDAEHPTLVEVTFHAEAEATRVEVRHSAGARSGDLFPIRAPRYAASWDIVLAALLKAASGIATDAESG